MFIHSYLKRMKKLLLTALVLLAAYQLKAQKTEDRKLPTLNNMLSQREASKLMDTIFNVKSLQTVDLLNDLKRQHNYAAVINSNVITPNFYSRMPVVKLHSDDPMPIAGRTNTTAFNMPVKKIKLLKPDTAFRAANNTIVVPALNSREEK
jgi:hypothetical protein